MHFTPHTMSKPLSPKNSSCPKQDDMTGDDRDVSPPALLHAGTGPMSSSSSAPGDADTGAGAGGRSMKWGKQLALAGGSSDTTVESPLPPSKSLTGREAEAEDGKKKRKKVALDASGLPRLCSLLGRSFKKCKGLFGHMCVYKSPPKQQAGELGPILLGQRKLDTMEGSEMKGGTSLPTAESRRKKIHMELDLNKEAPQDDDNDDEHYGGAHKQS